MNTPQIVLVFIVLVVLTIIGIIGVIVNAIDGEFPSAGLYALVGVIGLYFLLGFY